MMRSMFSGVSGLRSHQTMMDVIGDNIANVNSTGYKGSRVVFQETLSQISREGTAATAEQGVVNPTQVGLGVKLNAVDAVITQGAHQSTGRPSDIAIQGQGYFVLRSATVDEPVYSRSGSFTPDQENHLVDASGALLLGIDGEPVVLPEGIRSFSIATDGTVNVVMLDGTPGTASSPIALALFDNPAGLLRSGDGHLRAGVAAGEANVLQPGEGVGTLASGHLEMSNVDLAQEFTNMMIAQRGFQANSKVITSSDEVLQELVNLKR